MSLLRRFGWLVTIKEISIGEDVEKRILVCCWEYEMVIVAMGNIKVVLQKIKNRIIIWSSNSTSGVIPPKIKVIFVHQRDICTPMFTVALFTLTKHLSNLCVHLWINKCGICKY